MKPERRHLIHDVFDEEPDARRLATLLAGGRILRRKRWRRAALKSLAVVAVLGVAAFSIQRMLAPRRGVLTAVPAASEQVRDALLQVRHRWRRLVELAVEVVQQLCD